MNTTNTVRRASIGLFAVAGLMASQFASAGPVTQHDKPINLTAEVIDGSVYPEIDRIHPVETEGWDRLPGARRTPGRR